MKQVFPKPFVVIDHTHDTVEAFDTIEEAYKAGEAANGDYYLAKAIDVVVETNISVTEVQPSFSAEAASSEDASEAPAEAASEPVNA